MDVLIFALKGGNVLGALGVDVLGAEIAQFQRAVESLVGQPGLFHPQRQILGQPGQMLIEQLPARGEPDAPALPEEQLHVQLLLQGADVLAQGGLGDVQRGGGIGEVQASGRLQKTADLCAGHGCPPPGMICAKNNIY